MTNTNNKSESKAMIATGTIKIDDVAHYGRLFASIRLDRGQVATIAKEKRLPLGAVLEAYERHLRFSGCLPQSVC